MTARNDLTGRFLAAAGWADARRAVLAGDASNRRYDRLTRENGMTAVLMDADPAIGEDIRPFMFIARELTAAGLSAPEILACDAHHGFLILEDLGDDLFARILKTRPDMEVGLYQAATDVLIHLNSRRPPAITRHDARQMAIFGSLAYDWYLPGEPVETNSQARDRFVSVFTKLFAPLDDEQPVLVLRDYHAENLIWLPGRTGVARVGLLDFQDAMLGHPAYDLVSILQDARRDVPAATEAEMIDRFLDRTHYDPASFRAAYALIGLQRNLRILGIFARLCVRDGKPHYVDLIPRVWGHIQTNLAHPALSPLAEILCNDLPAPTTECLDRLKKQCSLQPVR